MPGPNFGVVVRDKLISFRNQDRERQLKREEYKLTEKETESNTHDSHKTPDYLIKHASSLDEQHPVATCFLPFSKRF